MEETDKYLDSEFSVMANEKIDYKTILFKQIDYIRFLRTQDMGDFIIFNFGINETSEEKLYTWLRNSSVFQNSVKSLQNLIKTYHDEEYNQNMINIKKKYKQIYTKQIEVIKQASNKDKGTNSGKTYNQRMLAWSKKFPIVYTIKEFDEIFTECLLLIQRAKFIGGNDLIKEETKKNEG